MGFVRGKTKIHWYYAIVKNHVHPISKLKLRLFTLLYINMDYIIKQSPYHYKCLNYQMVSVNVQFSGHSILLKGTVKRTNRLVDKEDEIICQVLWKYKSVFPSPTFKAKKTNSPKADPRT